MSFKTFYITWIITFFLTATFVFTIKNDVIDKIYGVTEESSFENYARLREAQPVKNAFGILLVILDLGLIPLSDNAITKKHYGISKFLAYTMLTIAVIMLFVVFLSTLIPRGLPF